MQGVAVYPAKQPLRCDMGITSMTHHGGRLERPMSRSRHIEASKRVKALGF